MGALREFAHVLMRDRFQLSFPTCMTIPHVLTLRVRYCGRDIFQAERIFCRFTCISVALGSSQFDGVQNRLDPRHLCVYLQLSP